MPRTRIVLIAVLPAIAIALSATAVAPLGPARFDAQQRLLFPADYREWVFLSSGQNMTYGPAATAAPKPVFDNVFVNPQAHAEFRKTGRWPDGTMFALEVRGGQNKGSINKDGSFQAGEPRAVEVHLKDKRFEGGWAFFGFDGDKPAKQIPTSASCYSCHRDHAAVDTTFVQFYPTLLPIAQEAGTLAPAYVKEEAALAAGH